MSEQRENELLELLDTAKDDPDAWPVIVDEVHALVADNQALRRQVRSLRSVLITLVPDIQNIWKAASQRVLSVWAMVGPYLEPDAPLGTDWDERVQAGYERDAEPPQPEHGDRGTCAKCGGEIEYFDPAKHANGGWFHVLNVAHHMAVFGGPA